MNTTEFLINIAHAIADLNDEDRIIFLARIYLSFEYDIAEVIKRINFYFHDDTIIKVKDVKDKIKLMERLIYE